MSRISKYIIVFGITVAIFSNLYLRFEPKDLRSEVESLKEVFPQADYFSGKLSNPPHYLAYKATVSTHEKRVIGYVFVTTELTEEGQGYSGPIKALVGLDSNGKITGIKILEHTETLSYVRTLPQFIAQFKGKPVYDNFKLGGDLDGITHATITSEAIARSVRKSIRTIARMKLGLKAKEVEPSFWNRFKNINIYLTIGVFLLGIISIIIKKRPLRKLALFITMAYLGFLANNYITTVTFSSAVLGKLSSLAYNFLWYLTLGLSIVLSFIVAGFFCGWVCPFGAVQELSKNCIKAEIKLRSSTKSQIGDIRLGILFFVMVVTIALNNPNISNFEPFATLFTRSGTILAWAYLAIIVLASFFNSRFFCKYLCAAGVIFGWIAKFGIYKVKAFSGCTGCGLCVKTCPTEAMEYKGDAQQSEPQNNLVFDYSRCISCLECVHACPENAMRLTRGV